MSAAYEVYCDVAREAAAAAAAVIRQHFRHRFDVRYKADDSPVTVADEAAEAAIRAVITRRYPEHGFYGEEGGASGLDQEWLWLVDPIDGTKAFVRGDRLFSTQIALMHRGELVVGVSAASEFGETAWAWRGGGAWLDGERLQVSATERLDRTILSFGNIQTLASDPVRWARVGELLRRVHRHRGYGDFLHYHRLAQGLIDAVVESDLNILDIAALSVIVTEAGGSMTELDGSPLRLATRSILASTPALHEPIRRALESAG
jgi:histidinol-phosphatase